MKKYIIPVIILSIIGGLVSMVLLFQHYNINSEIVTFFCGDSVDNYCREISLSGYSMLFGFPAATYALLFYSFLFIITVFLLYAGEDYRITYIVIAFPLASVATIASIIFIIIMITTGLFCSLCIITHLTNIILFAVLALFFIKIKKDNGFNISGLPDKYINTLNTVSHARVGLAAFITFVIFFVFSIFSILKIIDLSTAEKLSYNKITQYLSKYENTKPENLELHNSVLVAGNKNAELEITVFSDFLCSYCYKFYKIEEHLFKRFKNRIKFVYYSYPLDKQCNENINRSIYVNSCTASKTMIAASGLGILEEYMKEHFDNYKDLKHDYSLKKALLILGNIDKDSMKKEFIRLINSSNTSAMLQKDIKAAKSNGIKATPTIFIANKRIMGVRPVEVFEKIISDQLQKHRKNK